MLITEFFLSMSKQSLYQTNTYILTIFSALYESHVPWLQIVDHSVFLGALKVLNQLPSRPHFYPLFPSAERVSDWLWADPLPPHPAGIITPLMA